MKTLLARMHCGESKFEAGGVTNAVMCEITCRLI
jgi:hypothetical protein